MKRKNKDTIKTITRCFIELLGTGALITLAALLSQGRSSPRLLKAFSKYSAWRIKQMLRRLRFQGMIEYDEEDEHSPILLTNKGFIRKTTEKLRNHNTEKWDYLWRLVQFDIPDRKKMRRRFQRYLCRLGFFRVQNSVYVYPHDCKTEILLLARQFNVSADVMVSTVPYLGQYETKARNHYFSRAAIR